MYALSKTLQDSKSTLDNLLKENEFLRYENTILNAHAKNFEAKWQEEFRYRGNIAGYLHKPSGEFFESVIACSEPSDLIPLYDHSELDDKDAMCDCPIHGTQLGTVCPKC